MNCNTIYCSNAETTQTTVVLVPNQEIKTLENTGCYRLVICCNATATANLPVYIQVGTTNIPVLCKAGNVVYSSQLQKRVNYTIMYGNDNTNYTNGQIVVQNRVCPKASTIPSTTTTSEPSPNVDDTRKKY